MKWNAIVLAGISAISLVIPSAAQQPMEMVNAIVIGAEEPEAADQLVITGRNFDTGNQIQLTLGGVPLEILEHTPTVILAEIPADVRPGRYVLIAWTNGHTVREDSMEITLVAQGNDDSERDVASAGQDLTEQ